MGGLHGELGGELTPSPALASRCSPCGCRRRSRNSARSARRASSPGAGASGCRTGATASAGGFRAAELRLTAADLTRPPLAHHRPPDSSPRRPPRPTMNGTCPAPCQAWRHAALRLALRRTPHCAPLLVAGLCPVRRGHGPDPAAVRHAADCWAGWSAAPRSRRSWRVRTARSVSAWSADALIAGEAKIPVTGAGRGGDPGPEEARAWRTHKADPRAFMLLRAYIPTALRVEVTDPAGPDALPVPVDEGARPLVSGPCCGACDGVTPASANRPASRTPLSAPGLLRILPHRQRIGRLLQWR